MSFLFLANINAIIKRYLYHTDTMTDVCYQLYKKYKQAKNTLIFFYGTFKYLVKGESVEGFYFTYFVDILP